jgi:hypothetical protein
LKPREKTITAETPHSTQQNQLTTMTVGAEVLHEKSKKVKDYQIINASSQDKLTKAVRSTTTTTTTTNNNNNNNNQVVPPLRQSYERSSINNISTINNCADTLLDAGGKSMKKESSRQQK